MRQSLLVAGATVSIIAVGIAAVLLRDSNPEGVPYQPPTASAEQLHAVSHARVFFAHQSVGSNIVDGVPAVYQAKNLPAPEFTQLAAAGADDNLLEVQIGENGDPLGKIAEFDELIRSGLGNTINVAVLKLCYVDVQEGTDVQKIFNQYRDTLAGLRSDYPNVEFVPATVPLTTLDGPLDTVKAWLGRGDGFGPGDNLVREELNALLRAEYAGTGLLFDIAAIESTTLHGDRVTGRHNGNIYYALEETYASDTAHLNPKGAAVVADSFLAVVANAARE